MDIQPAHGVHQGGVVAEFEADGAEGGSGDWCVGGLGVGYWCVGYWCVGYWCIGYWCIGYWCIGEGGRVEEVAVYHERGEDDTFRGDVPALLDELLLPGAVFRYLKPTVPFYPGCRI